MRHLIVPALVFLVSIPAAWGGAQPTTGLLGPEGALQVMVRPEEGRWWLHWKPANGYDTQMLGWEAPAAAPPAGVARLAPAMVAQLGKLLGLSTEPELLSADLAFVLSARIRDDGKIVARWDIADGYYLYRDKFQAALSESPGFELVDATLPPGILKHDDYFGDVEVFYREVEYELEFSRVGDKSRALNLHLGYQGCADAGFCYAPIEARLPLEAPVAAAHGQDAP